MGRHKAIVLAITMLTVGMFDTRQADAQTFKTYRCADGTQFIAGFYDYDKRAFLQIDGEPVTLAKRLTLSGARYSGAGVTLRIGKSGATTVKHLKRPVTACTVVEKPPI
ncbi:lysozyme inhibitor [Bradyrhizobium sacchari]|uniref:Membrane-bound lysozyme inhibitor of c-type lysozyme MliC n=1 Tax=Bradyrhizobium sacchari TaxID=1399419 RepID=A0A560KLX3_9BRAD|nr:MliC family protein [Bradyrhizobium sacchari]OPY96170.1 lysozyme inhibitor [Bradyrhizobium sacchari]TWB66885.1 membrane-bound lysozyme inhibitor of c-type lysozyme MliC [Bradyrhizobium sacchari]TWB84122.1 membrane-bound lysozyme inhibitor of c-type lysozyme MliC [Bradyrhizobium sacchari]